MGNMTVKSVGVICCLSCSNACMCACIMLYRLFWKFATKTLGMDNIYPHCACTGLSHLLVCVNLYSAFFPELHTLISSVSLLIGITVPHRSEWVSHWGGGGLYGGLCPISLCQLRFQIRTIYGIMVRHLFASMRCVCSHSHRKVGQTYYLWICYHLWIRLVTIFQLYILCHSSSAVTDVATNNTDKHIYISLIIRGFLICKYVLKLNRK